MKPSVADFRRRLLPILLAQATGLACGVAGVKLTSKLVSPADYGLYGVFVSLVPLGATVIFSGLVKFTQRHWNESPDRAGLLREIASATFRRAPLLLGATVAATLLGTDDHRVAFGALLFASAFLMTFVLLAQAALQAERAHWRDFGVSSALSLTRSFLPPLFYTLTAGGIVALLGGFFVQCAVGVLVGAASLRRWWRPAPGTVFKPVLAAPYTGVQFMLLAVAGWTLIGLNRWLVAWRFGPEAAGFFTLAGNIGTLLPAMLGLVLLQYQQPAWFAAPLATRAERRALLGAIDRTALVCTVLGAGLSVALHLVVPHLVGPLISERYLPAARDIAGNGFYATSLTIAAFHHTLMLAARREVLCRHVDLSGAAALVLGGIAASLGGPEIFRRWLLVTPVLPWIVNRTVARRLLLRD